MVSLSLSLYLSLSCTLCVYVTLSFFLSFSLTIVLSGSVHGHGLLSQYVLVYIVVQILPGWGNVKDCYELCLWHTKRRDRVGEMVEE